MISPNLHAFVEKTYLSDSLGAQQGSRVLDLFLIHVGPGPVGQDSTIHDRMCNLVLHLSGLPFTNTTRRAYVDILLSKLFAQTLAQSSKAMLASCKRRGCGVSTDRSGGTGEYQCASFADFIQPMSIRKSNWHAQLDHTLTQGL